MGEQTINQLEISQQVHHTVDKIGLDVQGSLHDLGLPESSNDLSMTHCIPNDPHIYNNSSQRPRTLTSNEHRKIRRREQLQIVANDLIEETIQFYNLEPVPSIDNDGCNFIVEWGMKGLKDKPTSLDAEILLLSAIRNFLHSLPPRYAFVVDSPQEVLSHMRALANIRRNPTKAFVDVAGFCASKSNSEDGVGLLDQLAFCPNTNGMTNLKLVTIACAHTIGIMEFITGLLVSGGSKILDTDYMLSNNKVMMIRCIINKTGCIPLEKMERSIEMYLCASSGVMSKSFHVCELPTSDKIGAVDPLQIPPGTSISTVAILETTVLDVDNSDESSMNMSIPTSFMNFIQPCPNSSTISSSSASNVTNDDTTPEKYSLRKKLERREFSRPFRRNSLKDIILDESLSDISSDDSETINETNNFFSNIFITEKLTGDRVEVHRAFYKEKSKQIVIKVATTEGSSWNEDETLDELLREGEVAKKLSHANICKLLNVYRSPTCVCLAYEYCSKGTLQSILAQSKYSYDYFHLATDIARGMAYLHSNNIIHRDLKPDNIFIDEHNNCKIADFGMSIAHTGEENLLGETGTYRWMAPEVIRHESYSINSDIYSFGIVLWQLVTRSLCPFSELDPIEAALVVANEGVRPHIPSHVPEFIRRTITACWQEVQLRRPSFPYIVLALAEYGSYIS